jgi:hypothetical protein
VAEDDPSRHELSCASSIRCVPHSTNNTMRAYGGAVNRFIIVAVLERLPIARGIRHRFPCPIQG